jgi:hypothetical protein
VARKRVCRTAGASGAAAFRFRLIATFAFQPVIYFSAVLALFLLAASFLFLALLAAIRHNPLPLNPLSLIFSILQGSVL